MNNTTDGGLGLSAFESDLFCAAACLGAMFGAFLGSVLLSSVGRRRSITIATLPFIAGAVLQAVAQSYTVLISGRLLTGTGIGQSNTNHIKSNRRDIWIHDVL